MPTDFHRCKLTTGPRLADILVPERNSFGAIRLAMALAVVVSHCFYLRAGRSDIEPLHDWAGYTLGNYAVQVFFIVSGLLVAQSLDRSRSVTDFILARVLRIWPALIVCVLLTALVLGPLASTLSVGEYMQSAKVPAYVWRTLLLTTGSATLPGVFETHPAASVVNSSLWTLKYEVACYLLLAGIAFVLMRLRSRAAECLIAVALAIAIFHARPDLGPANSFFETWRYFGVFFGMGVAAYALRDRIVITWLPLPALAGAVLLAGNSALTEIASAIFLGYAAIWIASFRMAWLRPLTSDRDLSYGVYIFGVPITQLILLVAPGTTTAGLIAATCILALPIAALSWRLVEKPALAMRVPLGRPLMSWRSGAESR